MFDYEDTNEEVIRTPHKAPGKPGTGTKTKTPRASKPKPRRPGGPLKIDPKHYNDDIPDPDIVIPE